MDYNKSLTDYISFVIEKVAEWSENHKVIVLITLVFKVEFFMIFVYRLLQHIWYIIYPNLWGWHHNLPR